MKTYILILFTLIGLYSCHNDNFHDTGISNGIYDGSVWKYLTTTPSFDSLVVMIKHAGMQEIFTGKNPQYQQITLLGAVNYAFMQYLYKTVDEQGNQIYNSITDMPVELCRQIILSHVIPQQMLPTDFNYEVVGTLDEGGTEVYTLTNIKLNISRHKTPEMGVPDIGAEEIYLYAPTAGLQVRLFFGICCTENGYVYPISNTYQLIELK